VSLTILVIAEAQDVVSSLQHDVLRITNECNDLSEDKRILKEKCLKMEMELNEAQRMSIGNGHLCLPCRDGTMYVYEY
jgi:hypothetical protein